MIPLGLIAPFCRLRPAPRQRARRIGIPDRPALL